MYTIYGQMRNWFHMSLLDLRSGTNYPTLSMQLHNTWAFGK